MVDKIKHDSTSSYDSMIHVEPETSRLQDIYGYLSSAISPRPIALVATVSATGGTNLAPFSFFNVFSISPPMVAFSSLRRMRDGTPKDTELNLGEGKECSVQVVTEEIMHQQSIASAEYPRDVSEFSKAGLTTKPADLIAPPLVQESPVQMECVVRRFLSLGTGPGSGQLYACEILRLHIAKAILADVGGIDPSLLRLVGRMGGDAYCTPWRNPFDIRLPGASKPIGVDGLPAHIVNSGVYNAGLLARLASVEKMPSTADLATYIESFERKIYCGQSIQAAIESFEKAREARDYQAMFRWGWFLEERGHRTVPRCTELAVIYALESDDLRFACLAATYPGILPACGGEWGSEHVN